MVRTRTWLKFHSGEITRNRIEEELLFFHVTVHFDLVYVLPNIIKCSQAVLELCPAHDFGLAGDKIHNIDSESCLSCIRHTYGSSFSSLPNITKLSKGISYGRLIKRFLDNHKVNLGQKTLRVVSLAYDASTGLPFHSSQILSNYL